MGDFPLPHLDCGERHGPNEPCPIAYYKARIAALEAALERVINHWMGMADTTEKITPWLRKHDEIVLAAKAALSRDKGAVFNADPIQMNRAQKAVDAYQEDLRKARAKAKREAPR